MWVGVLWACILTFVWLRGRIRAGEWCCEVVGSCEVQLSCEVRCSTSSQRDNNLYVYVCECVNAVIGLLIWPCLSYHNVLDGLYRNIDLAVSRLEQKLSIKRRPRPDTSLLC